MRTFLAICAILLVEAIFLTLVVSLVVSLTAGGH